jgi:hypothetical protein
MKIGLKGKHGFVNDKAIEIISMQYDDANPFSKIKTDQNIARVKKGKLWGSIDVTGKEMIPFQYEEIWIMKSPLYTFK